MLSIYPLADGKVVWTVDWNQSDVRLGCHVIQGYREIMKRRHPSPFSGMVSDSVKGLQRR